MEVYVGYDTRLSVPYNVCKYSIERHGDNSVTPIIQSNLRESNIYTREIDTDGSTEFTLTRFLVPYLNNYKDWVLFCDCDFLFTIDANTLKDYLDEKYAVMVVKHDIEPLTKIKMDNKVQYPYPRKNWSSFILYNCKHPALKNLNPELINTQSPSYLHQFKWLDDKYIGELPVAYNYLVGYYKDIEPKIIHYTDGGPWFNEYSNIEYGDLWKQEYELYRKQL